MPCHWATFPTTQVGRASWNDHSVRPSARDEGKMRVPEGKDPRCWFMHIYISRSLVKYMPSKTGSMYSSYSTQLPRDMREDCRGHFQYTGKRRGEQCERGLCSFPLRVTLQYVDHWKLERDGETNVLGYINSGNWADTFPYSPKSYFLMQIQNQSFSPDGNVSFTYPSAYINILGGGRM